MTLRSRLTTKQRFFAAALGAAVLGGVSAPSQAADLGAVPPHHVTKHIRTTRIYSNWLDRCAYAGYYCLYAEYHYVYHYPFDDRPIAMAHRRYRFR